MMLFHVWIISALLLIRFVHCLQPSPTPTDISSINSLRDKMLSPSLDPKLRRALLRVLSKLEKGTLPIDPNTELSDEDFLKIFGQAPEPSEDLGSIESKELQDDHRAFIPTRTPELMVLATERDSKPIEKYNGNVFTYIPPLSEMNKKEVGQENNQGYTYIPPPTESSKQSQQNVQENQPTKPTPDQNEVYFQVPTPIDIPDQVQEDMASDKDYGEVQIEEDSDDPQQKDIELADAADIEDNGKSFNTTEVQTVVVSESINSEIKENNSTGNGTDKVYKHEVEFLPSSLVAAFTVQQDDKGIPRKVIPLDDVHQQKALVEKKQKELAEKEYRLQQQLLSLQEEKYRFHGALNNDDVFSKIRLPTISTPHFSSTNIFPNVLGPQELQLKQTGRQRLLREQQDLQKLRNLERERQQELLRQQEFQRQELIRQQGINRLQEIARQQELLRKQELQRQRELLNLNRPFTPNVPLFPSNPTPYNNYQTKFNNYNTFNKPQNVDFQKSLDYKIPSPGLLPTTQQPQLNSFGPLPNYYSPSLELNRVHRKEPQHFIGNFGHNLRNVDFQLQNLIAQSGVSTFLPTDNRDDLNIVSKVLSLNHGRFTGDNLGKPSEVISVYITPPSSVVEPPSV